MNSASKFLSSVLKKIDHPSGLTVYLYNMSGFTSRYVIFGTRYGSIDNRFEVDGKTVTVPNGIAHFLEHKMFECEDGDAFDKFAKYGAYSNAYTSFDRTCYLFNCVDNFYENLKILLNFVSVPYFTEETVKKEQGIIGQEITMYDDMPSWVVFKNFLCCLYKDHPVNIDIPGTVESIAQITPKHLYDCHKTFYSPSNMYLCVCGDFDEQKVMEVIDSEIKPDNAPLPVSLFEKESQAAFKPKETAVFDVPKPLFCFGYKENPDLSPREIAAKDIAVKMIAGDCSPLYKKLLEQKLIDESFSGELAFGRGFAFTSFEGTGDHPQAVADAVKDEIARIKAEGLDRGMFEDLKKGFIGEILKQFDSGEDVANFICDCASKGVNPTEYIKEIENLTVCDVAAAIDAFKDCAFAISTVAAKQK
ncbi:MAG: insulinase family protein [Oscillospiraceae bacterium]|nr:insulinase family protein [Candidatus Equicaccousia limihippi]